MISAIPGSVAATSPVADIYIDHASYCDLDDDELEDDVLIMFTCNVADKTKRPSHSEFYFTLTLPSGQQHFALVTVIGKYTTLRLALYWFDSAWESGWYNIQIDGLLHGRARGHTATDYDFDPPTGSGSGDPSIKVMFW